MRKGSASVVVTAIGVLLASWLGVGLAQPYTIHTVAGTPPGYGGNGGLASNASLANAFGLAFDADGNLYIADSWGHVVRRVSPTGVITTVAGSGSPGNDGDGGPATAARLTAPTGLAFDRERGLLITDADANVVRRVAPDGTITTILGTGSGGNTGDGGPATLAQVTRPVAVVADATGNIFVSDAFGGVVRRINPAGIVTTFARTLDPAGLAVDTQGNLYVAGTYANTVYKIDPAGIASTYAGRAEFGYSGDNGPAALATLNRPQGLALDAAGNLYIGDSGNQAIRKVTPGGFISTVEGRPDETSPFPNGYIRPGTTLSSNDVAVSPAGELYISATRYVVKLGSDGVVRVVAGNARMSYSGDGHPAANAQLLYPSATALDAVGNLYIVDNTNDALRRVSADGTITTIAGGMPGWLYVGSADGINAINARLNRPWGVAVDATGNIFIADTEADVVRRIDPAGTLTTVAGFPIGGTPGPSGTGRGVQLLWPRAVAVGPDGALFIADTNNGVIRKLQTDGRIETVAGGGSGAFTTATITAIGANLNAPYGIAVDRAGILYIADQYNHAIRRVSLDGTMTTVAGTGARGYAGDGGSARSALLNYPTGVAVDDAGTIYIADSGNHVIRAVGSDGVISTIAGSPGSPAYTGDNGPASSARLNSPFGVSVDAYGNVYVSDTGNNAVRVITRGATAVAEYYNSNLDHYFVTSLPSEIAALDAGTPSGWTRTGKTFGAYSVPIVATAGVCRFYLPPGMGDSHFYSANAPECQSVRQRFPGFLLESNRLFNIDLPDAETGVCPPLRAPVYRLWNNRADSNHRYTTDRAIRDAMIARGYISEGLGPDGIVYCAPQ